MTRKPHWVGLLGFAGWLAIVPAVLAQKRPYIGYTYPAGGQQATTFQVKLGGQDLDDVQSVLVTGSGVTARVVEYYRRLSNQEIQLLREQLRVLKQPAARGAAAPVAMMMAEGGMMAADKGQGGPARSAAAQPLLARVEKRLREWVQNPACASIASVVMAEVTISPEADAGPRELRLVTPRGVSNALVFQVGQLPEHAREPMLTATLHILGKEALALRKRPAADAEERITMPCTVNGQIAAGEVNRYRFRATKGQRLVISTHARQLIPYIADAVPGWFQPVLALYDARGREVAFADDYRFQPDPVILYQVPDDGEYVFAIHDSIYRGREDFVYRISVGELPFVSSIFPLGAQAGAALPPNMTGWNVDDADLGGLRENAGPGVHRLAANRLGFQSNRVPFVLDRLPDERERERNDSMATAQRLTLPTIVNGRIGRPDDWDVFEFTGKANDMIVVDVQARRLESPLDAVIKLTDASGRLLAFNDDREDLTAGVNTHHADSYVMAKLPGNGTYQVHIGDTARKGGEEYGYRMRISAPQPDFELRVVPSSVSIGLNANAAVSVYVARKDGFNAPIRLILSDPPPGLSAAPVTLSPTQNVARFTLRGSVRTPEPVRLSIVGTAKVGAQEIAREAVAAEDRMQAFLWRHLVPASELRAMVFDPRYQPPPKRVPPARPPEVAINAMVAAASASTTKGAGAANAMETPKPKFTKQQITGRLRQLRLLYEEGLLTDEFYAEKVAECEVPL